MTPSAIVTPWNFRPPLYQQIVDSSGVPLAPEISFRSNLQKLLQAGASVNVGQFGARGDGKADDTAAFQQAINQIIKQGGGIVYIPSGTFLVNYLSIPASAPAIILLGQGVSTILKRRGIIPAGHGIIDVWASNVSLMSFTIDAATTMATGLLYGADFMGINGNDPMAASLTNNTSVWVHGGATNFSADLVQFQHAAGYSVLLDATTTPIHNVRIDRCQFINNRPTLFGTVAGQAIYGSWNGGVLIHGDGRTVGSGVLTGFLMSKCQFFRNTGNCVWSHLYGLNALHENFTIDDCYFEDCGLDGILVGGVTGGCVSNNKFRRIGYTTINDIAQSVPRWLTNLNATALDSSGIVKGVNYQGNSFCSVNGGCLDLDGHCNSVICGNTCRVPYVGEPEYVIDQIAVTGPNNNASASYGLNLGNFSQTPQGAQNVNIVGNTFLNLPGGSIRLYAARLCQAMGNIVRSPSPSINPPISMGPKGVGAYQRCYSNRICHNDIDYSPAAPSTPAIFEDDSIAVFLSSETNFVFGNQPITGNGNAIEFTPSVNSGSLTYEGKTWFLTYIATETGANNAIASGARSGPPLVVGLMVQILLAHTLTAGGNTFAYLGGTAKAIKSHLNVANNIATGYAVGSVVTLLWDGTQWQDQSQ